MNNIGIVENSNQYLLFLPQNICIAQITLPPDSQKMADAKTLNIITKAIALRWGVLKEKKK